MLTQRLTASFKLLFVVVAIVALTIYFLRTPSLDRNWAEDVRTLAEIVIDDSGESFTISGVRDWRYVADGPVSKAYFAETYRIADLQQMFVYEQVLDNIGLIAHTFVIFDFGDTYDRQYLGVSVETRREVNEQYSLLKGAFRGFELHHTWATEADLVSRRVVFLNYALTKYRVRQPVDRQREYLVDFLHQTQRLSRTAEWYNTIVSNCTNVIINVANDIKPGFIPYGLGYVLTGLADDLLIAHGVLEPEPVAHYEPSTFKLSD